MDLESKWLRDCDTVEKVKEAIGLEQFLKTLPTEKRVWVSDRKPETCIKVGDIADEFEQVRKGEPSSPETQREKNKGVRGEHKPGLRCYNCWEEGHVKAKCPKPKDKALLCSIKAGARRKSAGGVYRNGSVEGRQVEGILLDTGCARTMVRKELVPEEKILMGDAVTIRCAHGDKVLYPLAALELEVDGISIPVEAAVSESLPVPVLLGRDVPQLASLLGKPVEAELQSEEVMVVVTQAQAKRQLEILRREQEIISGAEPKQMEQLDKEDEYAEQGPQSGENTSLVRGTKGTAGVLTKKKKRTLRQQLAQVSPENRELPIVDISKEELVQLQNKDETLSRVRGLVEEAGWFREEE